MKKLFLSLGLLTFCLSLGLAVFDASRELPEPTLQQPLKDLLPTGEGYGWTSEDLPLGDTEALEEASQRILNLTDFVYRRYTKGRESFDVYVAYWAPGTMPARDMNTHTPDTCWVGAGWEITERDNNFILTTDEHVTPPGRWRWFEKNNGRINVVFWHLLEGKPYQYGHQTFLQKLTQLITDPFRYNFNMRRDQYLIRISSPGPLDDSLWESELMESIKSKLETTGIVSVEEKSSATS